MQDLGCKNVAAMHTVIDEGFQKIYFFDEDNGRWGIFNTENRGFEYISEVMKEDIALDKYGTKRFKEMQQGAGKVYILDQQNTLHIFEREEMGS